MIAALGRRLGAMHLHDNDRLHDSHTLPYMGSVAFPAIIDALKAIGYRGDVTLEADQFLRGFPLELYPSAARLMADVAKSFQSALTAPDDQD